MSAAHRAAKAAAAACALVALLIGAPVALWLLGSPLLPSRLPDWPMVVGALTRPDDGRLLIGFVVLVGFAAWAVLSLSIVLELVSALLHRNVPIIPLPGFRLARVLAGVLVSALLGAGPASATPAAPPVPIVHIEKATTVEPASPTAADRVHVVAPRDTLWTIADSELGDPLRWREIYDLNVGRPQPDGGRLAEAGHLAVGWRLQLPADSHDGGPENASVVVREGDTLSKIAQDELGSADRVDDLMAANAGVPQASGGVLRDPDEIQIGWRIVIPQPAPEPATTATPAPAVPPPVTAPPSPTPTPPLTPQPTTAPPTTTAESQLTPPNDPPVRSTPLDAQAAGEGGDSGVVLALIGVAGSLAAATIVALTRRRRRQRRLRPAGHAIAVPDDTAGRLEWAASQQPSLPPLHYVDLALRCMTPDIAAELEVVAVRCSPTSAILQLAAPLPAPPPFGSDATDGWTLEADAALPIPAEEAAATCSPIPALVSIATAGDVTLMIDLEQRGVLRVGGNHERARALLRHVVAELATAEAAEDIEVLLVGLGDELVDVDPERLDVAASLDDALDAAQRHASATQDALDRFSLTSVMEGRLREIAPDSWLPTVVVCADEPDDGARERLAAHRAGAATAVIVIDAQDPDLLVHDDGELHVAAAGIDLGGEHWSATQLTHSAGTHLAAVLGTSTKPSEPVGPAVAGPDQQWADGMNEDGSVASPETPAEGPLADPEAERSLAIVEFQDPNLDDDLAAWRATDPAVPMIAILGEPMVRAPGTYPKVRASWFAEVLVYLSLHPAGVSSAKAVTDLWPEGHRISPATIRHAFYGARRWAGRGLDGDPAEPFVSEMSTDTSYRLRGHLLDWDLFRRLRKRAQARHRAGHPGAVADYEAAMALIRGPVLHPLRPGGYAWLNNHDQRHDLQIPGFVVDTAHELVEIALADGDTARARLVAEKARSIDVDVVYDRPLTDLMRIAHAEDNHAELEFYAAALLDARGFEVPEELAPDSFTVLNDLLPAGLRRPPRS